MRQPGERVVNRRFRQAGIQGERPRFEKSEQDRLAFEFFAVEGIAYAIYGASEIDADGRFIWSRTPWSSAPESAPESSLFTGRGRPATLYLPTDQQKQIYKLTVE